MPFNSSSVLGSLEFSQYWATGDGLASADDDVFSTVTNNTDFHLHDPDHNPDHFVTVHHENHKENHPLSVSTHWGAYPSATSFDVEKSAVPSVLGDSPLDHTPFPTELPNHFDDSYEAYFRSQRFYEPPCPFTFEEMATAQLLPRKVSNKYRKQYWKLRDAGEASKDYDPTGYLASQFYLAYLFSRGRAGKLRVGRDVKDGKVVKEEIVHLSCQIRVVPGTGLKHHFVQTGTHGKVKNYKLYVTPDVMEIYSADEFLALVRSYLWHLIFPDKPEAETRHAAYKMGTIFNSIAHVSLGAPRRKRFFDRIEATKTKDLRDLVVLESDIKHSLEEAIHVGDEACVTKLIEEYARYARGDVKTIAWVKRYADLCRATWTVFYKEESCFADIKKALQTYDNLPAELAGIPYVDFLIEEAQESCLKFLQRCAKDNPSLKSRFEILLISLFRDPDTRPLPRWYVGHELQKLQKDKTSSLKDEALQIFVDFFPPGVEVGDVKEGDWSQCVVAGWALSTHFEKRCDDLSDDDLRLILRVCQKSFALGCEDLDHVNKLLGIIETALGQGRAAVFDRDILWGLRRVFSGPEYKTGVGNTMGHVSQRVAFLLKAYLCAVPENRDELLRILSEDMPTWTNYWSKRAAVAILGDELSRDRESFDRWRATIPMRRPDHSDSEAQLLLYVDILSKNPQILTWTDLVAFFKPRRHWALKEKVWQELIEPAIFKLKGERGLSLSQWRELRRFMKDSPAEAKYVLFYLSHAEGVAIPVAQMARAMLARLPGPDFAGLGIADANEAIQKGEDVPPTVNFPLHDEVRKTLQGGPKRVLIIHNVKDGLGDELIRNATLMEALLAFNPELEIHIITKRPFLYAHPRVKVTPWTEVKDAEAIKAMGKYDAVVHHFSKNFPLFFRLHDPIMKYFSQDVPPLFITTEKQDFMQRDAFQLRFIWLSEKSVAATIGLSKSRMENVYETTHRLLAELGIPFFAGENRPREFSPLVAIDNPTARAEWETHTQGNTEGRPIALVNPFGGEGKSKGYVSSRDRRSVYHTINDERELRKKIESLVAQGYFVAIAPNGFKWGKRKKARRMVVRLPKRVRDFVTVLPEPKELSDQALKYFVSYADFIFTVEGGMLHQAYNQGKPHEVAFFHGSGSQRWIPLGAGPRQNVFVP